MKFCIRVYYIKIRFNIGICLYHHLAFSYLTFTSTKIFPIDTNDLIDRITTKTSKALIFII